SVVVITSSTSSSRIDGGRPGRGSSVKPSRRLAMNRRGHLLTVFRATCYYFYGDDDVGPAFVKVCAYFPYPMKIWLDGHEWAKRQATKNGIEFAELSNGFASATDP